MKMMKQVKSVFVAGSVKVCLIWGSLAHADWGQCPMKNKYSLACADPRARKPMVLAEIYTMFSYTLDSQGIMSGHDPNKVTLSHTGSHLIY